MHLSSKNFIMFCITLFLDTSLFGVLNKKLVPDITTAHTIKRTVAVRTKEFLWPGPLLQRARIAWVNGMCVTIQSRAKFASCRINLFESAVLHSKISTISSNSCKINNCTLLVRSFSCYSTNSNNSNYVKLYFWYILTEVIVYSWAP